LLVAEVWNTGKMFTSGTKAGQPIHNVRFEKARDAAA
jgi:hypothetical protein